MNIDYDGVPYPGWNGRSATITIHSFDKRSNRIDATLEAVMVKKGTTETRNLRVELHNVDLTSQQ